MLKITPLPTRRRDVLDVLRTVQGPTSVQPGCVACGIYEGVGDDQTILYLEQWKSESEMAQHIQSTIYARLLAAMDLAAVQPEIRFYETGRIRGMELIESLRT